MRQLITTSFRLMLLLGLGLASLSVPAGDSTPGNTSRKSHTTESVVNPAAVSESTSPLEALKILGADPTPDSLAEPQFLQPDAAFRLNTQVLGGNTLMIRWQIADTYYLYRNKFKFTLRDSPGIQLQSISIPPGKIKKDPYFGNVEVFFNTAQATIKLAQHAVESNKLNLEVGYQGCTELGLCYPPITRQLSVTLPATVQ